MTTQRSGGPTYSADTPISLPDPPPTYSARESMFGFVFTDKGLGLDITLAGFEELSRPTYAPVQDPKLPVEWGDKELDEEVDGATPRA